MSITCKTISKSASKYFIHESVPDAVLHIMLPQNHQKRGGIGIAGEGILPRCTYLKDFVSVWTCSWFECTVWRGWTRLSGNNLGMIIGNGECLSGSSGLYLLLPSWLQSHITYHYWQLGKEKNPLAGLTRVFYIISKVSDYCLIQEIVVNSLLVKNTQHGNFWGDVPGVQAVLTISH